MPGAIDVDRYRVTAWLAVVSRLAGVVFFWLTQPPEYRHARHCSISCSSCRRRFCCTMALRQIRRDATEGGAGMTGPASHASPRSSGSLLVVLAVVGGAGRLREILPRGAGAVLRVGRRALPVRIGRHRRRAGHSVLDLARAAAHLSRVSARTRRLRVDSASSSKDGHEMPIGLSKVTIGFPARRHQLRDVPHGELSRAGPAMRRPSSPAAPSHQTAPQQYLRFLIACASDPRFTAGHDPRARSRRTRGCRCSTGCSTGSRSSRGTRRGAAAPAATATPGCSERPDWGRGRIDPFNPVKFTILKQPIDTTIGNSDMVPLWNLKAHEGYALPLGRPEHATCRRSCCRRRSATARR